MDLLRAAIKALYYDYPIENAYGIIVGSDKKTRFLTYFNRMACGEDDGFSYREMSAYKDFLFDNLRAQRKKSENYIQDAVGLPLMFSEEVLTIDGDGYPRVIFENLFRWREIVKCLGEDLFTTSYLAKVDENYRTDFFWPNVIQHNEQRINDALSKGLADIHSHFGGAIDAFQFTWMCLMNDVDGLPDKFEIIRQSLNPVTVFDKEYSFRNLSKWCKVAAAIRVILFNVLIRGRGLKTIEQKNTLPEIMKSGSEEFTRLKARISVLRDEAKRTYDGDVIDYAINEKLIGDQFLTSPYCVYAGERQIEYAFFREYYASSSTKMKGFWVELFFLYESIKSHVRREFVFANQMSGLDTFIGFEVQSQLFYGKLQPICNVYSMQTGLRRDYEDSIETRVTKDSIKLTTGEYWKSLFSHNDFLDKDIMCDRLTFVVQLTRGSAGKNEHSDGRCRKKMEEVHNALNDVMLFSESGQSLYNIVGIDVGGIELSYRPEVFAHALRAAKRYGLGITYHVGEEFYDLVDGLRAIWEVSLFAKLDGKDRMGHCIALGEKPREYYNRKHCTLVMPKQVMLDNIVWLFTFAEQHQITIKPALYNRLFKLAEKLYEEIGFKEISKMDFALEYYYKSMLLRSDDHYTDGLDIWSKTALLDTGQANDARGNSNIRKLYTAYLYKDSVTRGEVAMTERFDNEYVKLVAKIQRAMIDFVNQTEVCIETCPSSNIQIGKLDRYDYHPSVRNYLNPASKCRVMNFAICTDDKGTFSTSLTNEFSLIALAAIKDKGWSKGFEKKFEQLILQGNKYRFKPQSK